MTPILEGTQRRGAVLLAAAASAAAGLVHAAAAGGHAGEDTLVALFALVAVAQLGWAFAVLVVPRPGRALLACGFVVNAGAVVVWALTRTVGFGVVDALAEVEDVGTQDLICAVLGAVAALGALVALATAARPARPDRTHAALAAGAAALVLAVPALTAGHDADHDHGVEVAAAGSAAGGAGVAAAVTGHVHDDAAASAGHVHDEAAPTTVAAPASPGGPATTADPATTAAATAADHATGHVHAAGASAVISLDDPRVTPEQRAAAQALIDTTRAGMAAFPDVGALTAAGYLSIGDGVTGYEHFVNWAYLSDDAVLDPNRIESIVAQVGADGSRQIVSAMYILPLGQTMADVPDIAGPLTTWHDHQDLCWSPDGKVVGRFRDGACQPAGTLAPTPPMLHVWMVENPCGPFAGIEGHGAAAC